MQPLLEGFESYVMARHWLLLQAAEAAGQQAGAALAACEVERGRLEHQSAVLQAGSPMTDDAILMCLLNYDCDIRLQTAHSPSSICTPW